MSRCARVRSQPIEPAVQWYPATHVSKLLVEFIDRSVGAFRRNTQASYRLLERARIIARKINNLIEFVEVNDDWKVFDTLTPPIEPLEDCLISLLDTVEKERNQYLITEQLESIDTCITFIEAWATQRADIRAKLELLWTKPEFTKLLGDPPTATNEDIKGAYHHDNISFLAELVQAAEGAYTAGPFRAGFRHSPVRDIIMDVVNKIKGVQSRLMTSQNEIEDSSIVLSIKTVMVIYSTMELIKARKPNALWLECAKSEVIWEAAQTLLTRLRAHLENGTPQLADVQNRYNEFLSRLQRGSMTGDMRLPSNVGQLMKHAGRIGRSYHAQALRTVDLCRELVGHFARTTNKTVQDFEILRLAIDKTLRALNAARMEDGAALTMFDSEAFDTSETSRAFFSARIEIRRCFDKFGLGIVWGTRCRSLNESIEKDKNRMRQINDLLAKAAEVAPPISVEVKIYKAGWKELHTTTCYTDLPPDTRLSHIQWAVVNEKFPDTTIRRGVLAHSHFEQAGKTLGMNVDVKFLTPICAKRTLSLIID